MLNLQEIFSVAGIKGIISIEDAWTFGNTIEEILFDLCRVPDIDRNLFLIELKQIDELINEKFNAVLSKLQEENFDCEEKAFGEIKRYVSDETKLLIDKITNSDIERIIDICQIYGLGLNVAGVSSLSTVIEEGREAKLSLRVYGDYSAIEETHMEATIKKLTNDGGYVLCIIDDQLRAEKRANQIINTLKKDEYNDRVICILVTSNDSSNKQVFDEKMYLEFIKKSNANTDLLTSAFLKSLYRIMLRKLKIAKKEVLDLSFDNAFKDPSTASFISKMAFNEGALNFDFILRWLEIKEKQQLETSRIDVIKNAIILSNALNLTNLNEIGVENYEDGELYKVDTFDLTVNALHKPIDVGDVFEVNGKYYVLIGQECDLAVRKNGDRKTKILEFVSAQLSDAPNSPVEIDHGYEQAIINNFPIEGHPKYISIDCGKRYYGKTEIFDMCSFDKNGDAQINLEDPLLVEVKALMPEGMPKIFEYIQKNFKNLIEVRGKLNNEKLFLEFGRNVGLSTNSNEVIDYLSYESEASCIKYNVKRLCRLRKHASLLHKLYLSYRGRQAEEAVCFSRYIPVDYVMGDKNCKAYCLLSTKNSKNEYEQLHNSHWVIKVSDVDEYLMQIYKNTLGVTDEYLNLPKIKQDLSGYIFSKSYDKAQRTLCLTIIKK